MKIYTGYFAQINKYKSAGLVPISIARFNRYYSGASMKLLAPSAEIIHLKEDEYRPIYETQLSKLSKAGILSEIKKLSNGKDCILLCYEKPSDFCHRRLVAEWLKSEIGFIPEFDVRKQPQLF